MSEQHRAEPPATPDPYVVAWAKLRTRAWAKHTAFSVWMSLVLANAIVLPGARLLPRLAVSLLGLLIGWTSLMWAVDRFWARVSCPRCGQRGVDWPFGEMIGWRMRADADMQCPHCGIKIGTPKLPRDNDKSQ